MRLFQWKVENVGKEVVLLAGAGLSEGCGAAETRLEYKFLVPPSREREEKQGGRLEKGRKTKGARDEKEEEEEERKKKESKKATRMLIGLEQVSVGYLARVALGL